MTAPGATRASSAPTASRKQPVRMLWSGAVAVVGGLLGLLPHVLHHVGALAGTALVAGSGGTALFAALGYLTSIPMLLRLRRRFGSWWAPAVGVVVFTAVFAFSAFVIGPAISPDGAVAELPTTGEHEGHHG